MKIKALTLWQPWASLMALEEKKIETRSWATNHRGLLAIHSAKRKLGGSEKKLIGHANLALGINIDYHIPFGQVVCVVNLIDCVRTQLAVGGARADFFETHGAKNETVFGDYSLNRYAWITEMVYVVPDVVKLRFEASGKQGLWDWEVDEGLSHWLQKQSESN